MEKTGEIDTKPMDSVQACISLFDSIGDHNKHKLTGTNGYEKESELEEAEKDLANYKVQLEAKDAAYMQALLKMEQQQKTIHELSELLKIAETGRDKYVNECSWVNLSSFVATRPECRANSLSTVAPALEISLEGHKEESWEHAYQNVRSNSSWCVPTRRGGAESAIADGGFIA